MVYKIAAAKRLSAIVTRTVYGAAAERLSAIVRGLRPPICMLLYYYYVLAASPDIAHSRCTSKIGAWRFISYMPLASFPRFRSELSFDRSSTMTTLVNTPSITASPN